MNPSKSATGYSAIRPLLRRAGLTDKEIDVYLAVLALKVARVSAIAKAAKQTRSHTYILLQSLGEKGLVSEVERGKVLHFVAEKPQRIVRYVHDRAQDLEEVEGLLEGAMPLLASLDQPNTLKPRVTILHGLEGMKQVYRDTLSQEFCIFFNPDRMFAAFGDNLVPILFGKKPRLRGREVFVDNAAARRYLREIPPTDDYTIRFLPKEISFTTEAVIVGDTVALFAYDDERTIVRIENRNIADSFRSWFEGLWKISRAP